MLVKMISHHLINGTIVFSQILLMVHAYNLSKNLRGVIIDLGLVEEQNAPLTGKSVLNDVVNLIPPRVECKNTFIKKARESYLTIITNNQKQLQPRGTSPPF
ncbi:hypothetical protein ACFXTO_025380 [Malus domestica]